MLISPHHGVLPSGDLVIKGFQEHAYPDLMVGDRILALAGKPMMDIFTFADVLSKQTEPGMDVTVERAGQKLDLKVELNSYEVQKPIGKVTHYQLSLEFVSTLEAPEPYVEQYRNPLAALSYGVKHTVEQSTVLFRVLGGLLSGDVPLKVLGGPVMIAKFAGDAAKAGLEVFFTMMALISVNLAVVNLLPIPILDGGQLVWIGLEGLKGRRLDRKAFENFQKIGFVLVLFLMVVATYNDFSRFWAEMLRGLKGLF
jgi:regulator of sigma E protease